MMPDVFFKGIPVNKAIIVRHTPTNERNPTQKNNKGAIPISAANLKDADDYISREGKWEHKSDIDRNLTLDDMKLYEDWQHKTKLAQGLDYISRLGDFKTKGIERQFDATLWNQYGPVNRAQVEKEMLKAGGAYIDSIITVSREHAQQLGLVTKEDFQRLMRATWRKNCIEWQSKLTHQRMFRKDGSDIRWVAAYHTDANQNLHVHIHTWNANGTILPGDTVLPLGTRKGKAEILKEGYSNIRTERNVRGDFLRDLQIAEVKHQLGFEITMEEKQRLELKGEKHKFEEKLSPSIDLTNEGKQQSTQILTELKSELERGEGRISNNEKAQELATKLIECVEEHSGSVKSLAQKNEEMFMIKAGFKGYLYNEEKDQQLKKWMEKELKGFIQSEKDELFTREKSKIIRELLPSREPNIELRKDLQHLDCSKLERAESISFSNKLTNYPINQNLREEGNQAIYVKTPLSSVSNPQFVKLALEDVGEINEGKAQLAKIELNKVYSVYNKDGAFIREIDGTRVMQFYSKADMARIRRNNPEMTPELIEKRKRRVEYKQKRVEYAEKVQERANQGMSLSQLNARQNFSVKHGMSLDEVDKFQYKMAEAARELERMSVSETEEIKQSSKAQMYLQQAAEYGLKGDIEKCIERDAQHIAEREGWGYEAVKQLMTEVYIEHGSKELEKLLDPKHGEFELKDNVFEFSEGNQRQTLSPSTTLQADIGNLLSSMTDLNSAISSSGKRLQFRRNLDEIERRDYAHEQGISIK